jgi:hypothetical protein
LTDARALSNVAWRSHVSGTLDAVPCRMMGRNLYTWPESRKCRAVSGVSFGTFVDDGMFVHLNVHGPMARVNA